MSASLIPETVVRLQSLGIRHEHRPDDHVVIVECPVCHVGMMSLREDRPRHYCPHPTCTAWMMSFNEIVAALVEDSK